MSSESAREFLDKLENDPELRGELAQEGSVVAGRVTLPLERAIALGARRGHVFSREEIVAAYAERGAPAQAELGDAELETVAGGAAVPTESISLNYAKITLSYSEQKEKGSLSGGVSGGYDLTRSKK